MDSMIERVARALVESFNKTKNYAGPFVAIAWDDLTEKQLALAFEQARAAMESMREPTKNMVNAAWNEMDGGDNAKGPLVRESSTYRAADDDLTGDTAYLVWQAMIDREIDGVWCWPN